MPTWKLPSFGRSVNVIPAEEVVTDQSVSNIRKDVPAQDPVMEKARERAIDSEEISTDAQDGVKKIEAAALVWSTKALVALYIGIFLVFFVGSLQSQTGNNLLVYVYSDFSSANLISVSGTVSTIIEGVIKLPLGKVMDIWGRPQGYGIMIFCMTIGIIMWAGCNGVKTYAAANIFYWVGYDGIQYVLDVYIADTSSLKNRALMFAFSTSPYIATTWCGAPLAARFLSGPGWRWGYGAFAIIIPIVCMPVLLIFVHYQRKAKQAGLLVRERSGRTIVQSLWHYAIEFDVLGMLLMCAGWSLLLLAINLSGSSAHKWQNGSMIAMMVVGGLCLVAFCIYERYFAPKAFLPFELLLDRTVLGACLLSGLLWLSFYCWDAYFYAYLLVVYGTTTVHTGYITNIYSIGSCFFAIPIGLIIRGVGSIKWVALACWPIQLLGTALMIHFRQPDQNIGYVIMCQIFIAFSGGGLVICEEMAVMAATSHERVAVVLALIGLFTSIGGAIGTAVSGAIWNNMILGQLTARLPEATKDQASAIFASYLTALEYPMGDPTRTAIIDAYAYCQKRMCIAATVVLVPALFCILAWRDIKVKDFRQSKGRVV